MQSGEARKIAMYLCQELAARKLKDIASHINLSHIGSVSFITHQVRKKKRDDKRFLGKLDEIVRSIMKQAT